MFVVSHMKNRIPYKSMVTDIVSKPGCGGLALGLDFIRRDFVRQFLHKPIKTRAWCIVQVKGTTDGVKGDGHPFLYPPALPWELRKAISDKKLFWVSTGETAAASITQTLLESGLCEGVLLVGLDKFARFTPASLWAKRWQIASRKGGSHFLWVHENAHGVVGFDVRLEWTGPSHFEIKKGYGFIEGKGKHAILRRTSIVDQPAA